MWEEGTNVGVKRITNMGGTGQPKLDAGQHKRDSAGSVVLCPC